MPRYLVPNDRMLRGTDTSNIGPCDPTPHLWAETDEGWENFYPIYVSRCGKCFDAALVIVRLTKTPPQGLCRECEEE